MLKYKIVFTLISTNSRLHQIYFPEGEMIISELKLPSTEKKQNSLILDMILLHCHVVSKKIQQDTIHFRIIKIHILERR